MWASFLIAVGLSMDNLAVTVAAGCGQHLIKDYSRQIWRISFLFSFAHFVMFFLGFKGGRFLLVGSTIAPWMACGILVCIGLRMIKEAFETQKTRPVFGSVKMQILLALATSLDALLVGTGLAFTPIAFWQTLGALVSCVLITSFCGFYLGHYLGRKFGRNMEIVGGCILIFVGVKVLLEGISIW